MIPSSTILVNQWGNGSHFHKTTWVWQFHYSKIYNPENYFWNSLFWIQPEQAEGRQDQPQQPYWMQCQWPHSCSCLIRWVLVLSWCLLEIIVSLIIGNQLLGVWWKKVLLLTVYYSRLSSGMASGVPLSCFPHLPLMKYVPKFGPRIQRVPESMFKDKLKLNNQLGE